MKGYVLKNNEREIFIGTDHASGGYAYETSFLHMARIWDNLDEVKKYWSMFDKNYPGFEIYSIKLEKVE